MIRIDRQAYHNDGIAVLRRVMAGNRELDALVEEVQALGRTYAPDFTLADSASLMSLGNKTIGDFYRALRYLPTLAALGSSAILLDLCRTIGMRFPALMKSCNIRMDQPWADEYLFHWHQDVTYLLGSFNSVTVWLPLGPADAVHGSVAYLPASHSKMLPYELCSAQAQAKTAQLSPRDVRLKEEPNCAGEMVQAEFGDAVVFSQFLVHRSTPNRSTRCRWTVQLRYSDLCEPAFRDAGFPFGDMTTVVHTSYLNRNSNLECAYHDQCVDPR